MPALPRRALRRARFRTALLIVLLGLGVLIPPTASAAPLPAVAPAPTALTAQVGSFSFALGPNQLRRLPIEMLPYYANSLVSSCGLTDPTGVAMYRAPDGMIYDHPVAQTRCALNMLRNYRISAEDQYLDQAIANAQRLLDRADTFQGASFFPYPFPYTNPGRGQMTPPWYSAMAQGQALSVFIRLLEWTGDARWRTAADQTFASFKIPRSAGGPWVVGVEGGRLWLDEYPTTPLDRVFNGHNFSAYGLYDYWRVTDSSEARLMLLGALNSTAFVGASRVRVPGGISQYCASDACLAHRVRHPSYHITHFGQLTVLFHITGHWSFASLAEALQADSPRTSGGVARLAAGTQDGYTFDSAGVGTLVTRVSLAAPATVAFTRRDVPGGRYHPGNGIWLRITEEPLAGLWVRESSRATPLGFVDTLAFAWNRPIRLSPGTFSARTFDAEGTTTGSAQASVSDGASWAYTDYARINGAPSVRLSTGPLAGMWLTLDERTVRDSTLFTDVDSSAFRNDIIWLATKEITRGCEAYRFCPDSPVTREQMASFLVRSLGLASTTRDFFVDDDGRPAENDINRLAASGITFGCSDHRFCPTRAVTRDQMASFLARALRLPASSSDFFTDDDTSRHEGDINRLAASGITSGCGGSRYCPSAKISRGQMAAFLHRALERPGATSLGLAPATPTPAPTPTPSLSPSPSAEPTATPKPSADQAPSPHPTPSVSPTPTLPQTSPGSSEVLPSGSSP